MIEHEERIAEALRAVTADVRARPTLGADVRRGAMRRRRRRLIGTGTAGTAAVVGAAVAVAVVGPAGLVGGGPDPGRTPTAPPSGPAPSTSAPAPAPAACTVERLPVPGNHPRSLVTGGDRTGRYLLGRTSKAGHNESHPILIWDRGQPRAVDMPGQDESLDDVNSAGVAVGSSFSDNDHQVAYVYRDGAMTRLPGSGSVAARAIGEQGVIVGHRASRAGQAARPVVWRHPGGPIADLPIPAGWEGQASDVDADGTIVGTVTRGPGLDFRGYVWGPEGTGRLLPLPQIDGEAALSFAPTSVDHGIIVGRATKDIGNGGFAVIPVLYDLRADRFTVLDLGVVHDVGNSAGWVAGADRNILVVASAGGRASLPRLAAGGGAPPVREDIVATMSEDGRVLGGQSVDANGQIQAVRWTCTTT